MALAYFYREPCHSARGKNCHPEKLTWPMAKRLKLFGITYLVGKISRSNFFFQGPLAK